MRVCETCKYKSATSPQELLDLYSEMYKVYPRVFYCKLLQAIKVYDPSSPAKMFDCELYEPAEA
jgi:hypothetical protein